MVEQPRERNLVGRPPVALGHAAQALVLERPRAQGVPGDKPDAALAAPPQLPLPLPLAEVVLVLDAHHLEVLLRLLDLLGAHLREAEVPHVALLLQLGQLSEELAGRHFAVEAVQLEQVDPLHPQALEARLASLHEVLGAGVGAPLVGPVAHQPRLGRDHEALGVGVQRLGDELLAHEGPVRVGRVDEVDAEVYGAPQHAEGLGAVAGRTPHPLAGDPHRPEAEARHGEGVGRAEVEGGGVVGHATQTRAVGLAVRAAGG